MSSKKLISYSDRASPRCGGVTPLRTKDVYLPPFFTTVKLRKSIDKLLPTGHHQRLRSYFDTYGCIRCSRDDVLYGSNGICYLCLRMIYKRMKKVDDNLQARFSTPPADLEEEFLRPYRSAQQLLADLVPKMSKRLDQRKSRPHSPAKVYVRWMI